MANAGVEESVKTLNVVKEIEIDAPIETAFAAVLAELGPGSEMPDGTPFPMKIEARPGGRWYRDMGNDTGHFWGHVQVIKPPELLELCGPLFMSYPAANFVQYRLTKHGAGTKLTLTHRGMGVIEEQHRKGVHDGWSHAVKRIKMVAEGKKGQ